VSSILQLRPRFAGRTLANDHEVLVGCAIVHLMGVMRNDHAKRTVADDQGKLRQHCRGGLGNSVVIAAAHAAALEGVVGPRGDAWV